MPFDVVSFAAGKKSGGGGSSGDIKTQPLNVTENGTYTAPSGRAYTPVNVNVKQFDDYKGPYEIIPNKQAQILETDNKKLLDNITIHPISDEYIIPSGKLGIDENGEYNVGQYELADVNVKLVLQSKELNIIDNGQQIVNSDSDYDGLSEVIVNVSVPQIEVEPLEITKNGTYTPTTGKAYGPVTANVSEAEEYTGLYEVESDVSNDITLETNGKIMTDDLIIKKITVLEVSNVSGGYTISIGK